MFQASNDLIVTFCSSSTETKILSRSYPSIFQVTSELSIPPVKNSSRSKTTVGSPLGIVILDGNLFDIFGGVGAITVTVTVPFACLPSGSIILTSISSEPTLEPKNTAKPLLLISVLTNFPGLMSHDI